MNEKRWLLVGLAAISLLAPVVRAQPPRDMEQQPRQSASSRQDEIARLIEEALSLFREGKLDLAQTKAKQIAELDPNNVAMSLLAELARMRIQEQAWTHRGEAIANKNVRRVYKIADLVVPIENGTTKKKTTEEMSAELIDLVKKSIAADSWIEKRGRGWIDFYPPGLALVVEQSETVHAEIATLLADLRRTQETQVTVEIRVLSVSESMLQYLEKCDLRLESTKDVGVDKGTARSMTLLSQAQLQASLEIIRGDKRTNMMQAPKITVLNGATGNLSIVDKLWFATEFRTVQVNREEFFLPQNNPYDVGIKFNVTPVVSADRRSVRLNFGTTFSNLVSTNIPTTPVKFPIPLAGQPNKTGMAEMFLQQPSFNVLSLQTTVAVADGQTVMLTGLQSNSENQEENVAAARWPGRSLTMPILAAVSKQKISTARAPQNIIIMMTPHIIIAEPYGQDAVARRNEK